MASRTYISGSSVSWIRDLCLSKTKVARCTLLIHIKGGHSEQVAVIAGRTGNSHWRAFRAIVSLATVLLRCVRACARRTVRPRRTLDEGCHTVGVVLVRALANVASRALNAIRDGLTVLVCGVVAHGTASLQIDARGAVMVITADNFS